MQNTASYGTAFTVAIDAHRKFGTTTGVSAEDRAITIRRTVDETAVPEDFVRPGHVNPLIARDGGVLVRAGQTEGSVDLCRLAGLMQAAAIIEILNEDGTMARLPDLRKFSEQHGIPICTIADLIEYRMKRERLVEREAEAPIRNAFGDWRMIAYRSKVENGTHVAMCLGDLSTPDDDGRPIGAKPPLVRVHSECLSGDVFGSMRCECGEQLQAAMRRIADERRGVLVYLRQEGRGIGLANKLKAYQLQDEGLDTVEANQALGLPADRRDYGVGAQILRDLGLTRVRILTNNPKKVSRLNVYGLEVTEQLPIEVSPNEINRRYLETKKHKMGHDLKNV
jgi:3,4-dihydroxy 2-butanone 4-phosphate synthase/GTP cyclohydrolase II